MNMRNSEERRLDRELRYHFDQMVKASMAAGMTEAEARRQAQLEFGGIEQIKEECRDARGRWMEDFFKDLGYAARGLRRKPGLLLAPVVSLALGIGANTAIFSLINAIMLRTLPVKEPRQLVLITRITPAGKPGGLSYPLFQFYRDHMQSISAIEAEASTEAAIVMDGVEEVLSGEM